ncbi:MAG TPA: ROK family protein [Acidimicrobiales bacterium]|nr:ROK family protein [Acidimicrobiales bacterium]
MDIGGTKVLGVAIDGTDEVVAEARVATPQGLADPAADDRREMSAEVADAVAQVVGKLQLELAGFAAGEVGPPVGVGAPGMLDRNGVLCFAPNLLGASGADILGLVRTRLPGVALVVENDANCAAFAEHRRGAAVGAEHALMITLGTGIGGGLVSGGRVLVGAFGFAGEVGHMLVDPSGPPCPCGRRGCWERYASGGGLGRLAREAAYAGHLQSVVSLAGGDPEMVRGEHVTRAALEGEPGAVQVMEELGWWVALGLANLTAVLDPDRIVLGGGLTAAGERLLGPTRRAYAELVEGAGSRPAVEIVPAVFGERAGAVGAAMVARNGGLW